MSRSCLVVLTDNLYIPGTLRLLESWQQHNPVLPIVALSRDARVLEDSYLARLASQRHRIETNSYADISPYKKSRSKRHAETFYKFEAFADFGFERNIYLDSDILCLRPAPLLIGSSPHALLAALDTGFKSTRGYKGHPNEINSGVLSIHKSIQGPQTIEQLKIIARDNPGRSGYNSGDQGILNKWIHRHKIDLGVLPPEYNLIKKDYADTSGLTDCRLLHYCDRKPWFPQTGERSKIEDLWNTSR
ncbi:glycosyltransferase [Pelagicoccus sp. SDUM812002]|uniref:glycosyltransferase n=1 Tax=Pelagicoccus sp. SDUM812002 TaxID=3041266 RepID=UPI00280DC623|nr:glycosyltransferase [Pelagicoccus sp. SDUM812002]MDQ8187375.1 glycosyltransferase [Pelagicoccus sp. SDUM812002]